MRQNDEPPAPPPRRTRRSAPRYSDPDGRRLTAGEVAHGSSAPTRPFRKVATPEPSSAAAPATVPAVTERARTRRKSADRAAAERVGTALRRHHRTRPLVRAGRVAIAACSVATLGVFGLAWSTAAHVTNGLGRSQALHGGPTSTGGAQNILLMGLDTRKDRDGNNLPPDILRQLHAGDGDEGGYNTNTLILVHIPADGKNIVAFSLPRDDLVNVENVDVSQAKIKEAYGRRKAMVEDQLLADGVTDQATLETRGREAGRLETIQTVRQLTGVPIDRFAEVSLIGFYDIARALGGIDVCLNHAVRDSYSGAHFPAGRQHLNAAQALAFVRQRHGLDNGDLDRTHRQQAFLLSVMHQLQSTGMLTDPGKLSRLSSALNRDVVLSDNWDLMSWGQQMLAPSDQHITFRTLPVERYDTFDGQDVNIIDPDAVRNEIQVAFGMRPATAPAGSDTSASGTSASGTSSEDSAATDTTSASLDGPSPDSGGAVSSGSDIPCVD